MITDFSKTVFQCSSLWQIMSDGKFKTPKQIYDDAVAKLADEQAKYDAYEDRIKGMKKGENQLAKITLLKEQLIPLEEGKNDDPLPDGCKSYLQRLYGHLKYEKWTVSIPKEPPITWLAKGRLAEDDAISLLSQIDGVLYEKNRTRFEGSFLVGYPDIIYDDRVIDVKAPSDIETFFSNLDRPLDSKYWWQIQGYMALAGFKSGEVCYCLVDMPDSLIQAEVEKLKLRHTGMDTHNYIAEYINNVTYSDIPVGEKVLRFPVDRDDAAIARIYTRVEACRKYLTELQNIHLNLTPNA